MNKLNTLIGAFCFVTMATLVQAEPQPTCQVSAKRLSGIFNNRLEQQLPVSKPLPVTDLSECSELAVEMLHQPFTTADPYGAGRTYQAIANRVDFTFVDGEITLNGQVQATKK